MKKSCRLKNYILLFFAMIIVLSYGFNRNFIQNGQFTHTCTGANAPSDHFYDGTSSGYCQGNNVLPNWSGVLTQSKSTQAQIAILNNSKLYSNNKGFYYIEPTPGVYNDNLVMLATTNSLGTRYKSITLSQNLANLPIGVYKIELVQQFLDLTTSRGSKINPQNFNNFIQVVSAEGKQLSYNFSNKNIRLNRNNQTMVTFYDFTINKFESNPKFSIGSNASDVLTGFRSGIKELSLYIYNCPTSYVFGYLNSQTGNQICTPISQEGNLNCQIFSSANDAYTCLGCLSSYTKRNLDDESQWACSYYSYNGAKKVAKTYSSKKDPNGMKYLLVPTECAQGYSQPTVSGSNNQPIFEIMAYNNEIIIEGVACLKDNVDYNDPQASRWTYSKTVFTPSECELGYSLEDLQSPSRDSKGCIHYDILIISDGCLRYSYVPNNPNKYQCTVCPYGYTSVKLAPQSITDYPFEPSLTGRFGVCVPSISAAKYGDLYRRTDLENVDGDFLYVPITCLNADPQTNIPVNTHQEKLTTFGFDGRKDQLGTVCILQTEDNPWVDRWTTDTQATYNIYTCANVPENKDLTGVRVKLSPLIQQNQKWTCVSKTLLDVSVNCQAFSRDYNDQIYRHICDTCPVGKQERYKLVAISHNLPHPGYVVKGCTSNLGSSDPQGNPLPNVANYKQPLTPVYDLDNRVMLSGFSCISGPTTGYLALVDKKNSKIVDSSGFSCSLNPIAHVYSYIVNDDRSIYNVYSCEKNYALFQNQCIKVDDQNLIEASANCFSFIIVDGTVICNECQNGYFLVQIDSPAFVGKLVKGCSLYSLPGVSKYQTVSGVNDKNGNKLLTQKTCNLAAYKQTLHHLKLPTQSETPDTTGYACILKSQIQPFGFQFYIYNLLPSEYRIQGCSDTYISDIVEGLAACVCPTYYTEITTSDGSKRCIPTAITVLGYGCTQYTLVSPSQIPYNYRCSKCQFNGYKPVKLDLTGQVGDWNPTNFAGDFFACTKNQYPSASTYIKSQSKDSNSQYIYVPKTCSVSSPAQGKLITPDFNSNNPSDFSGTACIKNTNYITGVKVNNQYTGYIVESCTDAARKRLLANGDIICVDKVVADLSYNCKSYIEVDLSVNQYGYECGACVDNLNPNSQIYQLVDIKNDLNVRIRGCTSFLINGADLYKLPEKTSIKDSNSFVILTSAECQSNLDGVPITGNGNLILFDRINSNAFDDSGVLCRKVNPWVAKWQFVSPKTGYKGYQPNSCSNSGDYISSLQDIKDVGYAKDCVPNNVFAYSSACALWSFSEDNSWNYQCVGCSQSLDAKYLVKVKNPDNIDAYACTSINLPNGELYVKTEQPKDSNGNPIYTVYSCAFSFMQVGALRLMGKNGYEDRSGKACLSSDDDQVDIWTINTAQNNYIPYSCVSSIKTPIPKSSDSYVCIPQAIIDDSFNCVGYAWDSVNGVVCSSCPIFDGKTYFKVTIDSNANGGKLVKGCSLVELPYVSKYQTTQIFDKYGKLILTQKQCDTTNTNIKQSQAFLNWNGKDANDNAVNDARGHACILTSQTQIDHLFSYKLQSGQYVYDRCENDYSIVSVDTNGKKACIPSFIQITGTGCDIFSPIEGGNTYECSHCKLPGYNIRQVDIDTLAPIPTTPINLPGPFKACLKEYPGATGYLNTKLKDANDQYIYLPSACKAQISLLTTKALYTYIPNLDKGLIGGKACKTEDQLVLQWTIKADYSDYEPSICKYGIVVTQTDGTRVCPSTIVYEQSYNCALFGWDPVNGIICTGCQTDPKYQLVPIDTLQNNGKLVNGCTLNKLPGVISFKSTNLKDVNGQVILTQSTCDQSYKQSTAPLKLYGTGNTEDTTGFACLETNAVDDANANYWTLVNGGYVQVCKDGTKLAFLDDGVTQVCIPSQIVDNGYGCNKFIKKQSSQNKNLFECSACTQTGYHIVNLDISTLSESSKTFQGVFKACIKQLYPGATTSIATYKKTTQTSNGQTIFAPSTCDQSSKTLKGKLVIGSDVATACRAQHEYIDTWKMNSAQTDYIANSCYESNSFQTHEKGKTEVICVPLKISTYSYNCRYFSIDSSNALGFRCTECVSGNNLQTYTSVNIENPFNVQIVGCTAHLLPGASLYKLPSNLVVKDLNSNPILTSAVCTEVANAIPATGNGALIIYDKNDNSKSDNSGVTCRKQNPWVSSWEYVYPAIGYLGYQANSCSNSGNYYASMRNVGQTAFISDCVPNSIWDLSTGCTKWSFSETNPWNYECVDCSKTDAAKYLVKIQNDLNFPATANVYACNSINLPFGQLYKKAGSLYDAQNKPIYTIHSCSSKYQERPLRIADPQGNEDKNGKACLLVDDSQVTYWTINKSQTGYMPYECISSIPNPIRIDDDNAMCITQAVIDASYNCEGYGYDTINNVVCNSCPTDYYPVNIFSNANNNKLVKGCNINQLPSVNQYQDTGIFDKNGKKLLTQKTCVSDSNIKQSAAYLYLQGKNQNGETATDLTGHACIPVTSVEDSNLDSYNYQGGNYVQKLCKEGYQFAKIDATGKTACVSSFVISTGSGCDIFAPSNAGNQYECSHCSSSNYKIITVARLTITDIPNTLTGPLKACTQNLYPGAITASATYKRTSKKVGNFYIYIPYTCDSGVQSIPQKLVLDSETGTVCRSSSVYIDTWKLDSTLLAYLPNSCTNLALASNLKDSTQLICVPNTIASLSYNCKNYKVASNKYGYVCDECITGDQEIYTQVNIQNSQNIEIKGCTALPLNGADKYKGTSIKDLDGNKILTATCCLQGNSVGNLVLYQKKGDTSVFDDSGVACRTSNRFVSKWQITVAEGAPSNVMSGYQPHTCTNDAHIRVVNSNSHYKLNCIPDDIWSKIKGCDIWQFDQQSSWMWTCKDCKQSLFKVKVANTLSPVTTIWGCNAKDIKYGQLFKLTSLSDANGNIIYTTHSCKVEDQNHNVIFNIGKLRLFGQPSGVDESGIACSPIDANGNSLSVQNAQKQLDTCIVKQCSNLISNCQNDCSGGFSGCIQSCVTQQCLDLCMSNYNNQLNSQIIDCGREAGCLQQVTDRSNNQIQSWVFDPIVETLVTLVPFDCKKYDVVIKKDGTKVCITTDLIQASPNCLDFAYDSTTDNIYCSECQKNIQVPLSTEEIAEWQLNNQNDQNAIPPTTKTVSYHLVKMDNSFYSNGGKLVQGCNLYEMRGVLTYQNTGKFDINSKNMLTQYSCNADLGFSSSHAHLKLVGKDDVDTTGYACLLTTQEEPSGLAFYGYNSKQNIYTAGCSVTQTLTVLADQKSACVPNRILSIGTGCSKFKSTTVSENSNLFECSACSLSGYQVITVDKNTLSDVSKFPGSFKACAKYVYPGTATYAKSSYIIDTDQYYYFPYSCKTQVSTPLTDKSLYTFIDSVHYGLLGGKVCKTQDPLVTEWFMNPTFTDLQAHKCSYGNLITKEDGTTLCPTQQLVHDSYNCLQWGWDNKNGITCSKCPEDPDYTFVTIQSNANGQKLVKGCILNVIIGVQTYKTTSTSDANQKILLTAATCKEGYQKSLDPVRIYGSNMDGYACIPAGVQNVPRTEYWTIQNGLYVPKCASGQTAVHLKDGLIKECVSNKILSGENGLGCSEFAYVESNLNKFECSACLQPGYHIVTLDKNTLDSVSKTFPGDFKACTSTLYPQTSTYKNTLLFDSKYQAILVPSTCDDTIPTQDLTKSYLVVGTYTTATACMLEDNTVKQWGFNQAKKIYQPSDCKYSNLVVKNNDQKVCPTQALVDQSYNCKTFDWDEVGTNQIQCVDCNTDYDLVQIDAKINTEKLVYGCALYKLPGVSLYQTANIQDVKKGILLTQSQCKVTNNEFKPTQAPLKLVGKYADNVLGKACIANAKIDLTNVDFWTYDQSKDAYIVQCKPNFQNRILQGGREECIPVKILQTGNGVGCSKFKLVASDVNPNLFECAECSFDGYNIVVLDKTSLDVQSQNAQNYPGDFKACTKRQYPNTATYKILTQTDLNSQKILVPSTCGTEVLTEQLTKAPLVTGTDKSGKACIAQNTLVKQWQVKQVNSVYTTYEPITCTWGNLIVKQDLTQTKICSTFEIFRDSFNCIELGWDDVNGIMCIKCQSNPQYYPVTIDSNANSPGLVKGCTSTLIPGVSTYKSTNIQDTLNYKVLTESTCDTNNAAFKQTFAPLKVFGKSSSEDLSGKACILNTQTDQLLIDYWTLVSNLYVPNCNSGSVATKLADGVTTACISQKIISNSYGCKNFKYVTTDINKNLFECAQCQKTGYELITVDKNTLDAGSQLLPGVFKACTKNKYPHAATYIKSPYIDGDSQTVYLPYSCDTSITSPTTKSLLTSLQKLQQSSITGIPCVNQDPTVAQWTVKSNYLAYEPSKCTYINYVISKTNGDKVCPTQSVVSDSYNCQLLGWDDTNEIICQSCLSSPKYYPVPILSNANNGKLVQGCTYTVLPNVIKYKLTATNDANNNKLLTQATCDTPLYKQSSAPLKLPGYSSSNDISGHACIEASVVQDPNYDYWTLVSGNYVPTCKSDTTFTRLKDGTQACVPNKILASGNGYLCSQFKSVPATENANLYECSACLLPGYNIITLDKNRLDTASKTLPGEFKACTLKLYPKAATYQKSTVNDGNQKVIFVPSTCDNSIPTQSLTNKPLVTGTDKSGVACVLNDPNVAEWQIKSDYLDYQPSSCMYSNVIIRTNPTKDKLCASQAIATASTNCLTFSYDEVGSDKIYCSSCQVTPVQYFPVPIDSNANEGNLVQGCALTKLPGVLKYKSTQVSDVNNKYILTQALCITQNNQFKQTLAPLKLFGKNNVESISGHACIVGTALDNIYADYWTLIANVYVPSCSTNSKLVTLEDGVTQGCLPNKIVSLAEGCSKFKSVDVSVNANAFQCSACSLTGYQVITLDKTSLDTEAQAYPGYFTSCTAKKYPNALTYIKTSFLDSNSKFIYLPSTCNIQPLYLTNKPLYTYIQNLGKGLIGGQACVVEDSSVLEWMIKSDYSGYQPSICKYSVVVSKPNGQTVCPSLTLATQSYNCQVFGWDTTNGIVCSGCSTSPQYVLVPISSSANGGKLVKGCSIHSLPGVAVYKGTEILDANDRTLLTQAVCDQTTYKQTQKFLKLYGKNNAEEMTGHACILKTILNVPFTSYWTLSADEKSYQINCNPGTTSKFLQDGTTIACIDDKIIQNALGCSKFKSVLSSQNQNVFQCSACTTTGFQIVTLDKATLDVGSQALPGDFKACNQKKYPFVSSYKNSQLIDSNTQVILVPSQCDNTIPSDQLTVKPLIIGTYRSAKACVAQNTLVNGWKLNQAATGYQPQSCVYGDGSVITKVGGDSVCPTQQLILASLGCKTYKWDDTWSTIICQNCDSGYSVVDIYSSNTNLPHVRGCNLYSLPGVYLYKDTGIKDINDKYLLTEYSCLSNFKQTNGHLRLKGKVQTDQSGHACIQQTSSDIQHLNYWKFDDVNKVYVPDECQAYYTPTQYNDNSWQCVPDGNLFSDVNCIKYSSQTQHKYDCVQCADGYSLKKYYLNGVIELRCILTTSISTQLSTCQVLQYSTVVSQYQCYDCPNDKEFKGVYRYRSLRRTQDECVPKISTAKYPNCQVFLQISFGVFNCYSCENSYSLRKLEVSGTVDKYCILNSTLSTINSKYPNCYTFKKQVINNADVYTCAVCDRDYGLKTVTLIDTTPNVDVKECVRKSVIQITLNCTKYQRSGSSHVCTGCDTSLFTLKKSYVGQTPIDQCILNIVVNDSPNCDLFVSNQTSHKCKTCKTGFTLKNVLTNSNIKQECISQSAISGSWIDCSLFKADGATWICVGCNPDTKQLAKLYHKDTNKYSYECLDKSQVVDFANCLQYVYTDAPSSLLECYTCANSFILKNVYQNQKPTLHRCINNSELVETNFENCVSIELSGGEVLKWKCHQCIQNYSPKSVYFDAVSAKTNECVATLTINFFGSCDTFKKSGLGHVCYNCSDSASYQLINVYTKSTGGIDAQCILKSYISKLNYCTQLYHDDTADKYSCYACPDGYNIQNVIKSDDTQVQECVQTTFISSLSNCDLYRLTVTSQNVYSYTCQECLAGFTSRTVVKTEGDIQECVFNKVIAENFYCDKFAPTTDGMNHTCKVCLVDYALKQVFVNQTIKSLCLDKDDITLSSGDELDCVTYQRVDFVYCCYECPVSSPPYVLTQVFTTTEYPQPYLCIPQDFISSHSNCDLYEYGSNRFKCHSCFAPYVAISVKSGQLTEQCVLPETISSIKHCAVYTGVESNKICYSCKQTDGYSLNPQNVIFNSDSDPVTECVLESTVNQASKCDIFIRNSQTDMESGHHCQHCTEGYTKKPFVGQNIQKCLPNKKITQSLVPNCRVYQEEMIEKLPTITCAQCNSDYTFTQGTYPSRCETLSPNNGRRLVGLRL